MQRGFDVVEAAPELTIRKFERRFWFYLHVTRDVGGGEKQIADLFSHTRVIRFVLQVCMIPDRASEFFNLLLQLVENIVDRLPVEANTCSR